MIGYLQKLSAKTLLLILVYKILAISSQQAVPSLIPHGETEGVVGGNASFTCISNNEQLISIRWMINGNDTNFPINTLFITHENGVETLDFMFLTLQNNASTISCIAYYTMQVLESNEVVLLVSQAYYLGPVGDLNVTRLMNKLHITWTPPPVVDALTNSTTSYCVELYNYSLMSEMQLECGINVTMFEYPNSWCRVFFFIITPHNIAGNGPEKRYYYRNHNTVPQHFSTIPQLARVIFLMTAPVCNAQVTFMNVDTGETTTLEEFDLNIMGANITCTTEQLNESCYNVSITASNTAGSATSKVGMAVCLEVTTDHTGTISKPTGVPSNSTKMTKLELLGLLSLLLVVVVVVVGLQLICAKIYCKMKKKKINITRRPTAEGIELPVMLDEREKTKDE